MIVKVCGMREAENIRAVEALGVDWMGFIFWEHSSRNVCQRPTYLPEKAKRVGVFVDAPLDVVCQHVEAFGLDVVQLHGSEKPDYLHDLRKALAGDVLIVKAFSIATRDDLLQKVFTKGSPTTSSSTRRHSSSVATAVSSTGPSWLITTAPRLSC